MIALRWPFCWLLGSAASVPGTWPAGNKKSRPQASQRRVSLAGRLGAVVNEFRNRPDSARRHFHPPQTFNFLPAVRTLRRVDYIRFGWPLLLPVAQGTLRRAEWALALRVLVFLAAL